MIHFSQNREEELVVKKHVWIVKCSEFCAPLPGGRRSCCDGYGSCLDEAGCGGDGCGGKCDPCASLNNKCFVPPKCGKVREKKTLEKKEITCKVPSYKCVVVYCCPRCGCGAQQAPAPGKTTQTAPLPPVLGVSFVK